MLEHLLAADPKNFIPLDEASPSDLLNAQFNTTHILDGLRVSLDEDVMNEAQQVAAREAFAVLASNSDPEKQKEALMHLNVPDAVKALVGMLTAYDWKFIEQAEQLRGYAVAKITEECNHPDARIRLRALELLGKITEVHLFTERVEVKKAGLSDSDLDEELKRRLDAYVKLEKEVIESEAVQVEEKIEEVVEKTET